jgi:AcrR family transcriptional regulator
VRRTERQLHQSLASLIHEKDYEAIVVKEILDRADVARSTFYTHFDGKEDLLLSCIRHTLAPGRGQPRSADVVERLLGFDVLVLDHIEAQRAGQPQGRRQPQLHRRLAQVLVQQVAEDIRRSQPRPAPDVPAALLADFLVTTFLEVVDWWLQAPDRPPAREARGLYRALVEPALRR